MLRFSGKSTFSVQEQAGFNIGIAMDTSTFRALNKTAEKSTQASRDFSRCETRQLTQDFAGKSAFQPDVFQRKWERNVAAAKVVWGKLTIDEIVASKGKAEKLAALVSERYAMDRHDANEQVKNFLDKCRNV